MLKNLVMKKLKFFALGLAFFTFGVAQSQLDIITPEQLVKMQEAGEKVVILDASVGDNYQASHIEGAVHIDHEELYEDGDVYGMIKSWIDLADIFADHGVDKNATVVIYDEGSQKHASRVYWVLKYIAKSDVKILHKDRALWQIDGVPMTADATEVEKGNMTPGVMPSIYISFDELDERIGADDFVLVDVRTKGEYEGNKKSEGHLPGAIHIDYKDLMDENGAFKSAQDLQAIAEEHGLERDMEIAFYCIEGIRACAAFVAFRNILGYRNVKVFDGSYNEWMARKAKLQ